MKMVCKMWKSSFLSIHISDPRLPDDYLGNRFMMTSSFSPIWEIEIYIPAGTDASTEYTQKDKNVNDKNGPKATL